MSFVICCDNDDCGRTADADVGLGGVPALPRNWETGGWPPKHYCSIACRQADAHRREPTREVVADQRPARFHWIRGGK